jgi:hypothetical protein
MMIFRFFKWLYVLTYYLFNSNMYPILLYNCYGSVHYRNDRYIVNYLIEKYGWIGGTFKIIVLNYKMN